MLIFLSFPYPDLWQ